MKAPRPPPTMPRRSRRPGRGKRSGSGVVGIGFSGFYVYQNLLFKPDRAALKESISKSIDKIL